MTGYKKYNGLDYRPKFSSSEKGRSREVHHVLDNIFRTRGGGSKKNAFSIDDINEVFVIILAIISLVFVGLYKLIVLIINCIKKIAKRYREKQKIKANSDKIEINQLT